MDRRLAMILCGKFPEILTKTRGDDVVPFSPLVFDVGDGWFPLLYRLFRSLSKELPIQGGKFEITQISEKYGILRFSGSCPQWSDRLIEEAETASENICDVCGDPGSLCGDGWYNVRCSAHAEGFQTIDDDAVMKMLADVSD